MCLGGGGSSQPSQASRGPGVSPEEANAANATNKNRDNLKADSSGLPQRPEKEYAGWQRDAKNDPNNKYHKGWTNPDGTTYIPDWVKGSSQSSKY